MIRTTRTRVSAPLLGALLGVAMLPSANGETEARSTGDVARVHRGLLAHYDFGSAEGDLVRDRSPSRTPVDLRIANPKAVRRAAGSLEVTGETIIRAARESRRLVAALKRSREVTIEAWVEPANITQSGPARIVTLSKNSSERNFTLGQDGDKFEVRLRTSRTNPNGHPSLSTKPGSLGTKLSHIVYTRDRGGRRAIYIDGKTAAESKIAGDFRNWGEQFSLALANEHGGGRAWRGTYHLVALYRRSLAPAEVEQNFRAGPNAPAHRGDELATAVDRDAHRFETEVAPILSRHCLECHDSSTRKGKLDLSRKDKALAGGRDGPPIVPGKSAESLLWELVESDDMPDERPPLTAEEKETLKKWIDDGATWSLDRIDPAVYVHGAHGGDEILRRLTVSEYIDTVRAAIGVDIASEARELLPPDLRADGFRNTAYNLNVDLKHVRSYAELAGIIATRFDALPFAARFSKSRRFTDDDMGKLISGMGKHILRGSLDEHEIIAYRGLTTAVASAGGSFEDAVRLIIEAMLQSPRFLYRVEDQRGSGSLVPVTDDELAARISYIVWGAPPDDELWQAAEAGELDSEGVERQVKRMLEDPRAIVQSERFLSDWLHLSRLENLKPGEEKFPGWDPRLADDMRAETTAFFREIVWEKKRPLRELFNAQVTFLTPRLARHYGLDAPGEEISADDAPARYDLSEQPSRGGLLTHASVLTIGGDEASMVTRGLFVFHELLRGVVKDPPPCVDTSPKPTKPGLTQRGIALERVKSKSCGGCHAKFEPLAFGLERFDGIGTYREEDEHGNELRSDGEILFPGEAESRAFESSAELMDLLANSERVAESITWKLTQFAVGRPLVASDAATVSAIHKSATENGGTYASMITAIATSDLVRLIRTESDEDKPAEQRSF